MLGVYLIKMGPMSSEMTPMMRQYHSVKEQYPDAILFYRLGDFYEMFFDDALKASKILDLTLTSRNKNSEDRVPMCGIPAHSSQTYIQKLLGCGLKVAICEQLEDPALTKGIVKRDVVQIYSPGLILDPECLESKSSNYLVAITFEADTFGLAKGDISTGHFELSEFDSEEALCDEILRIEPKEIIFSTSITEKLLATIKNILPGSRVELRPPWCFQDEFSEEMYQRAFAAQSSGLGLLDNPVAAHAGGGLLGYLDDNKLLKQALLRRPVLHEINDCLILDEMAKRNLELIRTQPDGARMGSLLWLLDKAQTSMGSRLLREWILYPLNNKQSIERRQEVVEVFLNDFQSSSSLSESLAEFADLERLVNRVLAEQANARDLLAIAGSLKVIPVVKQILNSFNKPLISDLSSCLIEQDNLASKIINTLTSEPPISIKEGGLIKDGINADLDELRHIEQNSLSLIAAMEAQERLTTGITSLKIRYNRVFGYYIEITNTHKERAPSHYIRKQTLANAERFITPELKQHEDKVLGAAEKTKNIEHDIFLNLRSEVAEQADTLKKAAEAISELDCLLSLALVARERAYVKPTLTFESVLQISKGRHPLVEAVHTKESFVPNDVNLSYPEQYLMMITGPNMAGKSTVMRQTALIVLMAHIGSFVPAESAVIGMTDRIFTRIGASDYLQRGQSTFMVEMIETAQILAKATQSSLIILDEIGRGTSTFDGLSIAWAVAETIQSTVKARTLFATHYHELTDLEASHKGISNFHMVVREWNSDIRFLRELKKGGTNRSLGIHVARMAGLPEQTVTRAKEILSLLEKKDLSFSNEAQKQNQPSLFDVPQEENNQILEKIKTLNINSLTPLEALNLLSEFQKQVE